MLSQHAPDCCVKELNLPFLAPGLFHLFIQFVWRMSVSSIETYATTYERSETNFRRLQFFGMDRRDLIPARDFLQLVSTPERGQVDLDFLQDLRA